LRSNRLTPHHLDHDHPVVRLGCGAQPIDCVGRDLYRGVKPEGQFCSCQVVVDCLRYTNDRDPRVHQSRSHAERVIAANRDERIDALGRQRGSDLLAPVGTVRKRVRARGAENRPAPTEDAGGDGARQLERVALHHTRPSVAEPNATRLWVVEAPAHDRPDNGV